MRYIVDGEITTRRKGTHIPGWTRRHTVVRASDCDTAIDKFMDVFPKGGVRDVNVRRLK